MERSEPTLVPEWLRNSGNVAGGGSSSHHLAPSSSHTDSSSLAHQMRNRISKSSSDFNNPRSAYLELSSSNPRRISSNGSGKHAYSSFNRNHRDKDHDREKERSNFGDHWDCNCSDPLATIFSGRIENDTLRRSHSMVSRKPAELLPRRIVTDAKNGNSNQSIKNGVLSGGSIGASIQKAVFEKDFPSLVTEEKAGVSDINRVSSPVLSTAGQCLPLGSSALIGGEGWTSALAEVPPIIGSGSPGSLSGQQTVVASVSAAPNAIAGLNMAEALVQTPSRARTAPQVSVKSQRLEELAFKQSRQLIPVTPITPKASVLNSSEKTKPKAAARNFETIPATKVGLQQSTSLHLGNQAIRCGNTKPDSSLTSGKLVVLKPRENGVSVTSKDTVRITNNAAASRGGNQNLLTPSVASANLKSTNNGKPSIEKKAAPIDPKPGSTLEKRPSLSQVQSRNDFFNLIKKKTSLNTSPPESEHVPLSPMVDRSSEVAASSSPHSLENGSMVDGHGDACDEVNSERKDMTVNAAIYPDEEEAAFLRSLGWEENAGEEGGLTEEEINAFFHQYMKSRPTLKLCQGIQPKLSKLLESFTIDSDGATAD